MQSICAVEFEMNDPRSFYRYLSKSVEGLKIQVWTGLESVAKNGLQK